MPSFRGKGIDRRLTKWRKIMQERLDSWDPKVGVEDVERGWAQHYKSVGHSGLANAAKFFGLDEHNPVHRAYLLHVLANLVFTVPAKGRPKGVKKWDDVKLRVLDGRATLLKEQMGRISDKKLAEILTKNFEEYSHIGDAAIRQRLRAAQRAGEDFFGLMLSSMVEDGYLPDDKNLWTKEDVVRATKKYLVVVGKELGHDLDWESLEMKMRPAK